MEAFSKVIRPGRVIGYRRPATDVFVNIKWDGTRLSITGVIGPMRSGNAYACGQINLMEEEWADFAEGWSESDVQNLAAIWDAFHLNGMTPGSPAQQEALRASPAKDHEARAAWLTDMGLNPDPDFLHDTGRGPQPYKYGSAWLRREVAPWALDYLRNLPDTDKEPAWV